MDAEAELAKLRDRIERQVEEYVEIVNELDRLSRKLEARAKMTARPATYHDD